MSDVMRFFCYQKSSGNAMQRKRLSVLKGRISKTRPARQMAHLACFFSKSGTKPHWNPEGPQNDPHARKRLISLGSSTRYIPLRPGTSRFRGPPLFLLHSVSGQQGALTRVHKLTRPRRVTVRPGRLTIIPPASPIAALSRMRPRCAAMRLARR